MNNPIQSIEQSTYAASTALNKGGLSGLLNKGLVREFIRSAVGENLHSLSDDFLSANLLSDIRKKSAQSTNQWDVLRVYVQMANAISKEEYANLSLRLEISDNLEEAAKSIKLSDNPALDLKIGTSLLDKHAKCKESKKAVATALQTIAQSIVDSPSTDTKLAEAASTILEATRSALEEAAKASTPPTVVITRKRARLFTPPTPDGS